MDARAIVSTVPSTSTLAPFVCAAAGPSPLGLLVFYALYLGALLLGLGLWRRQVTHLRRELSEARTGHARLDAQLRAARAEVRSLRLRIDALEQQQEEENVVPLREELRLTRAAVAELRAQLRRARRSSSSGPGAVPMPPAVQVTAAVEAVAFELIGRLMLDKAFDRDGTARRLVMARRLARNDWNGFETAYKEALIDSGEVQPDSRGFADSTPGERSEHWKLYKARWYGEENEFLREVKAAKRAANVGGTGAVQP